MKVITKEEAFAPIEGQVSIPIDLKRHSYEFTRWWFRNRNCSTWSTFLKPKFGDGRSIKMIQIGVFEGQDLVWCLQNILTHEDSKVLAIDPWLATTKLTQEYMDKVEDRAIQNLGFHGDKVYIRKGFSQEILNPIAPVWFNPFGYGTVDLIVIDGDHNAGPVCEDALLSFGLLKPGGLLVFDDVRNRVDKSNHVQQGIEKFLSIHGHLVKFEWSHRYCDCYSKI